MTEWGVIGSAGRTSRCGGHRHPLSRVPHSPLSKRDTAPATGAVVRQISMGKLLTPTRTPRISRYTPRPGAIVLPIPFLLPLTRSAASRHPQVPFLPPTSPVLRRSLRPPCRPPAGRSEHYGASRGCLGDAWGRSYAHCANEARARPRTGGSGGVRRCCTYRRRPDHGQGGLGPAWGRSSALYIRSAGEREIHHYC